MDVDESDPGVQHALARMLREDKAAELRAEIRRVTRRGVGEDVVRLVGGGDFIFNEPDYTPAVWGVGEQVLWAEGEGLMIAGGQGLGKTTIAQQLVLARAGVLVGDFLGLPVARSDSRTLYLAMDRPRQAARSMRRMVPPTHREMVNERVAVWRGPIPLDITASSEGFADWVFEVEPSVGLVVVDSVKDLAPGLSSDEVGAGMNIAWQELIARGVQLLVLHHERKASDASGRAPSLDAVYGSTWLTSGLGSVAVLAGTPGDPEVTLHHLKQPAEEVGPLKLMHDHSRGATRLQVQVTVESVIQSCLTPVTVAEVAERAGVDPKTAARRIKMLVERERVRQVSASSASPRGRTAATYLWNYTP